VWWRKVRAMFYVWKGYSILQNIQITNGNIHARGIKYIDNIYLARNRFYTFPVAGKQILLCPRCSNDDLYYVGEYEERGEYRRDYICEKCNTEIILKGDFDFDGESLKSTIFISKDC
jgi:superfamily II helicase